MYAWICNGNCDMPVNYEALCDFVDIQKDVMCIVCRSSVCTGASVYFCVRSDTTVVVQVKKKIR